MLLKRFRGVLALGMSMAILSSGAVLFSGCPEEPEPIEPMETPEEAIEPEETEPVEPEEEDGEEPVMPEQQELPELGDDLDLDLEPNLD